MSLRPSLLALDLMDTVIRDPFFTVIPALCSCPPQLLSRLFDREAWIAFELGQIDEKTYLARMFVGEAASLSVCSEAVRAAILGGYSFIEGMEDLLEDLRARRARVWALSNYPVWISSLRQALTLDRFFEGYTVSCEIGARKPDAAAFAALSAQSGVAPHRCLVVDDRAENVSGACHSGMQAVQFRDVGVLREQLRAAGVL